MPRSRRQAFVWVKRNQTTAYRLEIGGTDYTTEALIGGSIELSRTLCPEVGTLKFVLDNATAEFSTALLGGETVEFYLDFSDASTLVFSGKLEKVEQVQGDSGYVVKCEAAHHAADLLDLTVTESYDGSTTVTAIIQALVDSYFSGYTYSSVGSFSETPVISWQNRPFWSCIADLADLVGADCYVDESKDFHFFTRGSVNNDSEAAVYDDTLLSIEGLGTDTIDVRNKVIVYGKDADGDDIIYTATDSSSQSSYGVKETIIRDESVTSYGQAVERGDAELALLKDTVKKGKVNSWILPSLAPGEMFYVISPLQEIHERKRAVTVTHRFPDEVTLVEVEKVRSIPRLFKDQFEKSMAQEDVSNINRLSYSLNLPFDDYSGVDSNASTSNIAVSGGYAYLSSDTTGTLVSEERTTSSDVSLVELRVSGEAYGDAVFEVSSVVPEVWEEVTPKSLHSMSSQGKHLKVRVSFNSASTRLDSVVVLYS